MRTPKAYPENPCASVPGSFKNNNHIPIHVAIIPDGNRRWARKNGLPRLRGHEVGGDRMFQAVEHLMKLGVRFVTVWGFSTDNWKRKDDEVFSLFKLLESWINKITSWAQDNEVRLKYIGRLQELPDNLQNVIQKAITLTENNQGLTLNLAFNYTGRIEIIDAVNKLIAEHPANQVDENTFSRYLYTGNTPDVDLVIRTAGEFRISNFMLWQIAYSEFYIASVYWPDFDTKELDKALAAYSERIRTMGGDG
jgi:undecaprenyl diphosphate synthase